VTATLRWAGEELQLWPERALFWPRTSSLLIADPHFGKPATFRSAGVHVPEEVTRDDLIRLDRLLDATSAKCVMILGDFLHARSGRAPETIAALTEWRERRRSVELLLVRGNHDRGAGDPPPGWGIRVVDQPYRKRPFLLRHEPVEAHRDYVLAGHLHPAVTLRDTDGSRLRAPCFLFGRRLALLPAFGSFTGTARVRPQQGERVFAVGPDAVIEVGASS
jgi:DNA ligase-associated metallophosphoesterase